MTELDKNKIKQKYLTNDSTVSGYQIYYDSGRSIYQKKSARLVVFFKRNGKDYKIDVPCKNKKALCLNTKETKESAES